MLLPWMEKQVVRENAPLTFAFMARGAALSFGQEPQWEACQWALALYTPCDSADEYFRQAIEAYAQSAHGKARWAMIVEALRKTQQDPHASFFDEALSIATFSFYEKSALKPIFETGRSLYSNRPYGPFVILPRLLFPPSAPEPSSELTQLRFNPDHNTQELGKREAMQQGFQSIVVDESWGNEAAILALFTYLKECQSLEALFINNRVCFDTKTQQLTKFFQLLLSTLPRFKQLKTLCLAQTRLNEQTLKALADTLWKRTFSLPLENLNLSGNGLTDESLATLLTYYPWGNCKTLDLSDNLITDRGAQALLNRLKSQPSALRTLYLGEPSSISAALRDAIAEQLTTHATQPAPRFWGWLSAASEKALATTPSVALPDMPQDNPDDDFPDHQSDISVLTEGEEIPTSIDWQPFIHRGCLRLTAEDCLLNPAQMMDFMTWLKSQPGLTTLILDEQPFTEETFEALTLALPHLNHLTHLSLRGTPLSLVPKLGNTLTVRRSMPASPFITTLAKALPQLKALEILDLRDIPLSKADVKEALLPVISQCPHLRLIHVDKEAATLSKQTLLLETLAKQQSGKIADAQQRDYDALVTTHRHFHSLHTLTGTLQKGIPRAFFRPFSHTHTTGKGTPNTAEKPIAAPVRPSSNPTPVPLTEEAVVNPITLTAPKKPFTPRPFKRIKDAEVVPDAPTLFITTEREITFRLGKKDGYDYEQQFQDLVKQFIGERSQTNYRRKYYDILWEELAEYVRKYSNRLSTNQENPNIGQNVAGGIARVVEGVPVLAQIATVVQFGVDQATEANNQMFREQMSEFYSIANPSANNRYLLPLLERLAFLVTVRYGDRTAFTLTKEKYSTQALKDVETIGNFIGYGHTETHPFLEESAKADGCTEFTLKKMDKLMERLFGVSSLMLPMLRTDWVKTQALLETGQRLITYDKLEPLPIPSTVLAYPSEPKRIIDITLQGTTWSGDEQHFRQMLLNAARDYQDNWECFSFFEQKAVQWFFAHGGHQSMKQAALFEKMARKMPFDELLTIFVNFFKGTKFDKETEVEKYGFEIKENERHSSLKEGALHTEMVLWHKAIVKHRRQQDAEYPAYKKREERAQERAKTTLPFLPKGHDLRDNTAGFFYGPKIQERQHIRQTCLENAKLIQEEIATHHTSEQQHNPG